MPTSAAVKRDAAARRARIARLLRESAADRAPLKTVKHVKGRALALAFLMGAAGMAALIALLTLTR